MHADLYVLAMVAPRVNDHGRILLQRVVKQVDEYASAWSHMLGFEDAGARGEYFFK